MGAAWASWRDRGAGALGVRASVESVDRTALTAIRDDIASRNHKGVERHLEHAGVRVVRASVRLTGPRSVRAEDGREFTAPRGIVLTTGSGPRTLPSPEPDGSGPDVSPEPWPSPSSPTPTPGAP